MCIRDSIYSDIEILLFLRCQSLLHIKHESLQVFAFRMIDVDRMIGWLMQLVQDANLSSCLGCCSKHSVAEIILGNHLRTAEGEEDSTLLDSLQALYIQAGISLQHLAQRCTVLGKGWRIEDNEIILLVVLIQILERILAECLVAWVAREVESDVLISQLDRLGAAVHGVNRLGIAAHGID